MIGYKDFLSSPFFPRYGTISLLSTIGENIPVLSNKDIFDLTGRMIVNHLYLNFAYNIAAIGPGLTLTVDGNIIFEASLPRYYEAPYGLVAFSPLRIISNSTDGTYYTVGWDETIHVGDSIKMNIVNDDGTYPYNVYTIMTYYPVE